MGHLLNKAVERLSFIPFEDLGKNSLESYHVLIKEYLRRVNHFLNEMDTSVDRYPVFSFAKTIGETVDEKVYQACPSLGILQNPYMKAICYCYLEITELADQGTNQAIKYINLYEPIIKFIERGGSFTIKQGEMIVGNAAYPLTYWRGLDIEEQDISDIALERVDNKGI
ncbi:hypothetical protein [Paenibacillus xylanexedens]|uniref:hypothetical protein n=1 Tax=Paenibacillus xylanexedens TaxID=528191 RepID=UPI003B025162